MRIEMWIVSILGNLVRVLRHSPGRSRVVVRGMDNVVGWGVVVLVVVGDHVGVHLEHGGLGSGGRTTGVLSVVVGETAVVVAFVGADGVIQILSLNG